MIIIIAERNSIRQTRILTIRIDCCYFRDSNNHRPLLGDSAMLATGGKSGLKPQGTISSAKQLRVDQKKYVFNLITEYSSG